jgi:hypothetical protein
MIMLFLLIDTTVINDGESCCIMIMTNAIAVSNQSIEYLGIEVQPILQK